MPELIEVCTLAKMKEVGGKWSAMQPYISAIIDNREATKEGLAKIMELNPIVLVTMNQAVGMYSSTNNECSLEQDVTKKEWMNILAEVGKQRMLGHILRVETYNILFCRPWRLGPRARGRARTLRCSSRALGPWPENR